ncbi:MAG: hypothetical protein G01um101466_17 [Parcubacteria group bacterium Gr01-1014_66]|nr:MAG: hypothetical protein G01um101466_17 [Parcubacteria group bacterium Gr01-1014_66]
MIYLTIMKTRIEQREQDLYTAVSPTDKEDMSHKALYRSAGEKSKLRKEWAASSPPPFSPDQPPKLSFLRIHMKKIVFSLFVGGFLVIAGLIILLFIRTQGKELSIIFPRKGAVDAGEVVAVPILLHNTSRILLKDVRIFMTFPQDALVYREGTFVRPPVQLTHIVGDILPGEEKREEVQLSFFGHEGEEKALAVRIEYRPEHVRSSFSYEEKLNFMITRVPILLSWELPQQVTEGQQIEVRLHYTLQGSLPIENVSLELLYPDGFVFQGADPSPDEEKNLWHLKTLEPGVEGRILLRGTISGNEEEVKRFVGVLGLGGDGKGGQLRVLTEKSGETIIARQPVSVEFISENGKNLFVTPGETIFFPLRYKNNTLIPLNDVRVRVVLDEVFRADTDASVGTNLSTLLDWTNLSVEGGGILDTGARSIVWTPGGTDVLRELLPGEEGTLSFSIKTRVRPAMRSVRDQRMEVRAHAFIEVPRVPEELAGSVLHGEDTIVRKVHSVILFEGKSSYYASVLPNTGSLPPRVGQTTTYTILWELRNFTNDLGDAEVRVRIPPNVRWEGKIFPVGARITFDETSGEIRWAIGRVAAGTGVVSPSLNAAFQVSLTPAANEVGATPTLVDEIRFHARDTFTDRAIDEVRDALTIRVDDPQSNPQEWRVVP